MNIQRMKLRDLIISFIVLSICFAISIAGIYDVKGFISVLPIYSLDGTKVLKWSVKIWIIIFAISAIMMLISIIAISPENIVKLFMGL